MSGNVERNGAGTSRFGCPWPSLPEIPWNPDDDGHEVREQRVRALVAELRTTGKPQVRGWLHRADGHDAAGLCCLGIACHVAIDAGLQLPVTAVGSLFEFGERRERTMLPVEVYTWYGLDRNPRLQLTDTVWKYLNELEERSPTQEMAWSAPSGHRQLATFLNDSLRLPFPYIADCFEYTYLRGDWNARVAAEG